MYETDVDMNVGCDGFQIRNAGIHWFQSRKLGGGAYYVPMRSI